MLAVKLADAGGIADRVEEGVDFGNNPSGSIAHLRSAMVWADN